MKAERKEKGKGDKKFNKHHKGAKGNGELQKSLNLTQDQQDRLAKMREENKAKFEAFRNDKSLTEEQKKEKMQTIKKEQHEKMKSILTKEQIEKIQAAKKDHHSKMKK